MTRDLTKKNLKAGDVGTVVLVYKNGEGFEVEFMTLGGETFAVETLMKDDVRPISQREITHARAVA